MAISRSWRADVGPVYLASRGQFSTHITSLQFSSLQLTEPWAVRHRAVVRVGTRTSRRRRRPVMLREKVRLVFWPGCGQ